MFNDVGSQSYKDEEGNLITLTPINARIIMLEFTGNFRTLKSKHNKIKQIDIFSRKFTVGESLNIEVKGISFSYKINYIEFKQTTKNRHNFHVLIDKFSNSTNFLMPTLTNDQSEWMADNLVNAYSSVETGLTRYMKGKYLYLVYRYSGEMVFYNFEKELDENPSVLEVIDIGNYILIVVEINKRFHDDYNKIMKSKYSEISEELKKRILQYHEFDESSVMAHVLVKSEDRRSNLMRILEQHIPKGTELWEAMDEFQETFRLDLITSNNTVEK